jgi:hypothetical protein
MDGDGKLGSHCDSVRACYVIGETRGETVAPCSGKSLVPPYDNSRGRTHRMHSAQWAFLASSSSPAHALCRILIASIMEEVSKDAWQEIVGRCEEAGVDAFELNFSCPHGMPERKMGMAMGQDPELLKKVLPHAGYSGNVLLLPLYLSCNAILASSSEDMPTFCGASAMQTCVFCVHR